MAGVDQTWPPGAEQAHDDIKEPTTHSSPQRTNALTPRYIPRSIPVRASPVKLELRGSVAQKIDSPAKAVNVDTSDPAPTTSSAKKSPAKLEIRNASSFGTPMAIAAKSSQYPTRMTDSPSKLGRAGPDENVNPDDTADRQPRSHLPRQLSNGLSTSRISRYRYEPSMPNVARWPVFRTRSSTTSSQPPGPIQRIELKDTVANPIAETKDGGAHQALAGLQSALETAHLETKAAEDVATRLNLELEELKTQADGQVKTLELARDNAVQDAVSLRASLADSTGPSLAAQTEQDLVRQLEQVRQEYDQLVSERAQAEDAAASRVQNLTSQVELLESKATEQAALVNTETQSKLEEADKKHRLVLAKTEAEIHKHRRLLDESLSKHRTELKQLAWDHTQHVDAVKEALSLEHQAKLGELQQQFDNLVNERQNLDTQLDELETLQKGELDHLRATHQEQMAEMQSSLEALEEDASEARKSSDAEHATVIDSLRRRHEQTVRDLRSHAETTRQHAVTVARDSAVEQMHAEHASELKALRLETSRQTRLAQERTDALEVELQEEREAHERTVSALESDCERQVRDMTETHAARIQELVQAHAASMLALQDGIAEASVEADSDGDGSTSLAGLRLELSTAQARAENAERNAARERKAAQALRERFTHGILGPTHGKSADRERGSVASSAGPPLEEIVSFFDIVVSDQA